MKRIKFLLALVFLLFFAKVFPQNNKFMIAWYDRAGIGYNTNTLTQRYKDMQALNFNCAIMDFVLLRPDGTEIINPQNFQWVSLNPSKSFLDSAYKYGIKILLTTPENSSLKGYNSYDKVKSQEGLAYWGNHPALWGFHILDEPYNWVELSYPTPYANDIRAFNPNLLRWVCMPYMCCDTMSFDNYGQFIQDYIDADKPNILAFDEYPIMDEHIPPKSDWYNDLFYHLDIMSRKSVENNIPFVYVLSSLQGIYLNGKRTSTKILSEYVTSYFMYAGLCYGAKGLAHFDGWRYPSTFTTEHKERIKNINKTIIDNEDVLLSLQFRSAYHKSTASTLRNTGLGDSIPSHSKWQYFSSDIYANEIFNVNNPFIAQSGSSIDSLAILFLTDNSGSRYFWVFNKSLSSSEDIQLGLKAGNNIVDVLENIPCLTHDAVIHLEPAEAKLFKIINTPNTYTVTENTTWSTNQNIANNIAVPSGVTLTITDTAYLSSHTITIRCGGQLILSGGVIDEGKIIVQDGGEFTISNNGKLLLGSYDNLSVQLGAKFNLEHGKVLLK